MYQNTSKCTQNELCKCFVHEITKEVVFITFKVAKIDELLLSLRCGRPCRALCFAKRDSQNGELSLVFIRTYGTSTAYLLL